MNSRQLTIAAAAAFVILQGCCNDKNMKTSAKYIGPSEIEIKDGRMTAEAMLSTGRISDPQLSPDGKLILYGISYVSFEENRSCRNLFVCNADGSGNVQLTKEASGISNARWSPDGKTVWFIQGGQIKKAPFKGDRLGKAVTVSDVPDGVGEFALSPDGSRIMYSGTVRGSVEVPSDADPALDKANAYATEDLMYRHWDHWTDRIPHTFVAPLPGKGEKITPAGSVDILGEDGAKFELPLEPFGGLEQLSWSPDGRHIAYACKKLTGKEYAFSTDTEIYLFDIESGRTDMIAMGGGYDTDPVWSPDGGRIAWLSMERNGYEADRTRLFVAEVSYSEEGAAAVSGIRELSEGFKYNAAAPVWAADGSSLYFNALAEGLQAIYRVSVSGGAPVRLTDEDLWYDFDSPFAVLPDGTLLTSYCSMDFPTELVAVKNGRPVRITHENDVILSQLDECRTEARYIKTTDGKDMLTWVLYPPHFDSAKVYPAIEICLGGPQGSLSQGWSYRWNYRLMASQGYVVILPNRRGTTAFGQEWCEQISGDYPGQNMEDYLSAARALKAEPYIGKMAACGASYGGYSVYYLAGVHGDVYDCFIAHAGIFNEEHMYFTTEEMWFPNWDNGGLHEYGYVPGQQGAGGDGIVFGGIRQGGSPWSTLPKSVRHYANSPHKLVQNWHTPILCIHGGSDFRVPYDEGMAAFNAARLMGVPSRLVVFPDENHWILKPQNALYWHREYFGWLSRWLHD